MSRTISPEALGSAIQQELTAYAGRVRDGLDRAAEKAVKKLVKLTRATAPVGHRGAFAKHITYKKTGTAAQSPEYTWGVGGKEYRLTHLIVHGHITPNGGRSRGNQFLENAINEVMPEYEKDVRSVIQNG